MSKKNILVLGSEGAIGSQIVNCLSRSIPDAFIIRVGRRETLPISDLAQQTLLIGDLLNVKFVDSVFKKYDIDVIIFCAAKWNGINQDPTVLDENVTMFNNVLNVIPETLSNFVYLSSSAVYPSDHCDDSKPIKSLPKSTYGKSKLINELSLLNKSEMMAFATTIYRPFHVVSPYENYNPGRSHITTDFVYRYIESKVNFDWDSLPNDVFIPFYWVDDLCKIVISNMFNKDFAGKIFNIGASTSSSILHLAFCIATVANKFNLSSHKLPMLEKNLCSVENNMISKLDDYLLTEEKKDIADIVENFIKIKYGITYEY